MNVVSANLQYFRYTADNIDLNRNFPDYYGATLPYQTRAQETSAVMSWTANTPFVLSANYHGGAFVINTPLDRYCKRKSFIHYVTYSSL